jgi:hypothetical protein
MFVSLSWQVLDAFCDWGEAFSQLVAELVGAPEEPLQDIRGVGSGSNLLQPPNDWLPDGETRMHDVEEGQVLGGEIVVVTHDSSRWDGFQCSAVAVSQCNDDVVR